MCVCNLNIYIYTHIYMYECMYICIWGFSGGSDSKESAYNAGDPGSVPGLGRSPGEENGYPFQYSCLVNSVDRGAWQATIHGVSKSQTRLSNFSYLCLSIERDCTPIIPQMIDVSGLMLCFHFFFLCINLSGYVFVLFDYI